MAEQKVNGSTAQSPSMTAGANTFRSLELACGALLFVAVMAVYIATLTPSVPFWDSGEFVATSYVLGIPHPPGTPFYVLIGRLVSLVPIATIAVRLNFLSAICSGLSVLLIYFITLRFLKLWFKPPLKTHQIITCCIGALSAGLFAAFSNVYWDNAIEAEVYPLSCVFMLTCFWLALKWQEKIGEKSDDGLLLLTVYLLALSIGVHLGTVLIAPAILVFALLVNWRSILNSKFIMWALALFVLGVSVHLYLIFRARLNPPINEADPDNWRAFWDVLRRDQYKPVSIFNRKAEFSFQVGLFMRYLKEQFVLTSHVKPLSVYIPLALGVFGAVSHAMRDKKGFALIATFFAITSLGLIIYLNFSINEVRERDYFYTFAFLVFAMWIGMGLASIADWVRNSVKSGMQKPVLVSVWTISILLPLLPLSPRPISERYFRHDRHKNYVPHDYAYNMLAPLDKNAVIITNGDNDTFPLWYIQEVEGVRKDVRVVNLSLLNTAWYIKQLKHMEPKVPIEMPDDVIDGLEPYRDADGNVVLVKDIMIKHILETDEKLGAAKKPIYLAVTVPDQMGLSQRLTLEGLVFRISPQPVGPYGKVDVERTRHNLNEVFRYGGLLTKDGRYDESVYKDDNSFKLVQNYAAAHVRLAWQLKDMQRMDEGVTAMEAAAKINPYFEGVVGWLGLFYESVGKFDKARDHYSQMLKKFGNDQDIGPQLHYRLGLALEKTGNIDGAIEELKKAADAGQFSDAAKNLCRIYWDKGQKTEALAVLKKWLDMYPEDKEMRMVFEAYNMMYTQEKSGQKPGGRMIQLGKP